MNVLIFFLLLLGVASLVLRRFFLIIHVPTDSMEPTLKKNSYHFVLRRKEDFQRFDLVVFLLEEDGQEELMVKRLVGLPGETIHWSEDPKVGIRVDGQDLWEDPFAQKTLSQSRESSLRNCQLPRGCFFFLGDHRSNSRDSRYWKIPWIHHSRMVGKVLE